MACSTSRHTCTLAQPWTRPTAARGPGHAELLAPRSLTRRRRRQTTAQTTAGAADLHPPAAVEAALKKHGKHREDTWTLEDVVTDRHGTAKEQGRRQMRQLSTFTFRRWAFHRSTDRYARHMMGIFQSRIVRGLAQPLASAGTTAALVCAYEEALRQGVLPDFCPSLMLPPLPFDITSFALSLLLVFRTNTSYDRWQQALTNWGDIATRSRDTLRQLLAYTAPAGGPGVGSATPGSASSTLLSAAATGRWLVAFSRALKAQLTEDSDLRGELKGILTPAELDLLCTAYHPPSFALSVLTELTAAAPLRESQRVRLDENLTFFEDAMGSCERILRTPIPLSYTRHTSRFMVIWLSCLPLGMWNACGWGTVPLTVVVSFLLLGIEEIGVAIEEPFSILPLDDLCHEVEVGLSDIVDQAASSKHAAKVAVSAAAAAAVTAAAADALAASGSSSSSIVGGGRGEPDAAGGAMAGGNAAAAGAAGNAVAPLLPGALGRASVSRELAPAGAVRENAMSIYSSLDDGDELP